MGLCPSIIFCGYLIQEDMDWVSFSHSFQHIMSTSQSPAREVGARVCGLERFPAATPPPPASFPSQMRVHVEGEATDHLESLSRATHSKNARARGPG